MLVPSRTGKGKVVQRGKRVHAKVWKLARAGCLLVDSALHPEHPHLRSSRERRMSFKVPSLI